MLPYFEFCLILHNGKKQINDDIKWRVVMDHFIVSKSTVRLWLFYLRTTELKM